MLSLRQLAGGLEFRVNGSDIGTIKKAARAVSIASNVRLEKTRGTALPYRTLGRYAVRQIADPEKGMCVELELVEPNLALPTVFHEYAVLKLKRPVTLAGKPNSLGLWVKGNSGWGQVYWVLEDARGQLRITVCTNF
ncbi:MAG: hypothetical protein GX575_05285 [Candidatus Anammoximicrobium sp.]|nr:hypothetical protein [Candidatus Anammoximicrobium sp.]